MSEPHFARVALIGLGLIGSSLSHVMRRERLAEHIAGYARSAATRAKAVEIGLVDSMHESAAAAVRDADLVILCVPVGACGEVAREIGPVLKEGAIVTDVGSVKTAIVRDVAPHLPANVHFVPGHPVAGTEQSGPEFGLSPNSSPIAGAFSRRCPTAIPPRCRSSRNSGAPAAPMSRR